MVWTEKQVSQHKKVAESLIEIKNLVFDYVKDNFPCTEREVQKFILEKFDEFNLVNEIDLPIVAFGKNTSLVHYLLEGEGSVLDEKCLILIDMWARLSESGAPYADITWIGCRGIPSKEFTEKFELVLKARGKCIEFIKSKLRDRTIPKGDEIHQITCDVFSGANVLENFKHGTGHSLGLNNPHGNLPYINSKNNGEKLSLALGYTLEPGLYFGGEFGVRSEIDFYIDTDLNLILTTSIQEEIILV